MLLKTIILTSTEKFDVIIIDNDSNSAHKSRLKKIIQPYNNIFFYELKNKFSFASYNHANALDYGLGKVKTKFCLIVDSDIVFLKKGWNKLILDQFDEKTAIVGFESTGRDGFPQVTCSMINTEIFRLEKISCMPKFKSKSECTPLNDTAFEWRILNKNYKTISLPYKNTRHYHSNFYKGIIGIEEYFIKDEIVASHFGRGSSLGSAKYFKSLRIPNFLKRAYGSSGGNKKNKENG